jgi:hypothetical protein
MVLLYSCFITNKSSTGGHWEMLRTQGAVGVTQDRGNLQENNKLDITKYTLSSLAKYYPWKRAIIKIQLDDNYYSIQTEKDLENFIKEEFKNVDLYFSNKRNLTQQDWIDTYKLINDDFIYHCCNHDHVVLDNTPEYIQNILMLIKDRYKNEYISLIQTHFPEVIRTSKCGYIDHNFFTPSQWRENYKLEDEYFTFDGFDYNSINIISKNLYENWYLTGNWDDIYSLYPPNTFKSGHVELPRIDGIGITDLNTIRNVVLKNPIPKQKVIVPYKEIARHFDGYFHQGINNNQCPSLDIPLGFFEKNIKIRYGYDDRKEGWVNINPKNDYYYAHNKSGTDYKFTIKELPLFWKDRISVLDLNPHINEEETIQYRLKSILEMIYSDAHIYPNKYHSYIDKELEIKILNKYLKQYPQYQIA